MTPDALPAAIIEPAEARDQLGAHGFVLDEALPLLGDDLGRRPLGEVRPRQLRPGEADALVDGFLILLAGILLITPGVLTDVFGIAFLIPPIRALIKRGVKSWLRRHVEVRVARATGMSGEFWQGVEPGAPTRSDEIIDARVLGTRVEDVRPAP